MATQTVDSHQTSTSDEQTVKLSSEAVKVTEQINVSSLQETIEDDREKSKPDNLHILDSILSTSEEKTVDIQVEPPVIEVKKTDEGLVVGLPVHDNEQSPSTEPVGEEATELPVIAFLEKTIKEFDLTNNVKSPPEKQPTAEVIESEVLEEPPAVSAEKVEEQQLEVVGLPKSEEKSLGDIVDSHEKEKLGAVQFVTEVAEKVEIVSIPVEEVEEKKPIKELDATNNVKSPPEEQPTAEVYEREALEIVSVLVEEVEEKKPKINDNPDLSVVADSGKGPAETEEEQVTECVSIEKEPDKEPEIYVLEESVEPTKKEAQLIEAVPVEEPIKVVAKEIIETVEPLPEKEQPAEVHPIKELEEVKAKEITKPIEVSEEKNQASEVQPAQEAREVIETKISEPVEVPEESELLVEVHPTNEQVLIEKETNKSIEPLKNEEQSDEVISQNKLVEVKGKEASVSIEPLMNKEEADEGFSVTESEEMKEKETNDSTLGSEKAKNQKEEFIEVKDGIEESHEITKHVQDTHVEPEIVKDEKPLALRDDIGAPTERKFQEEEGSGKQDLVDKVIESSGPIEDSDKGLEKEQQAPQIVSVEKEPKKELETTCVLEESIKSPKEAQPTEDVTSKEPAEVLVKEVIETIEHPTEKEQPVETTKEIHELVAVEVTETVEPPIGKEQPVVIAKEKSEVVEEEVIETVEPLTEKEKPIVISKEVCEVVVEEVTETVEPPTEKEQSVEIEKEMSEVIAEELTEAVEPPTKKEQPEVIAKEISEVVAKEVTETVEPPMQKEQTVVITKETSESVESLENKKQPDEVISHEESVEVIAPKVNESFDPPKKDEQADEVFPVGEPSKQLEEERPAKELVNINNEPSEEPETSPVLDLSAQPHKKEEQTIEVLSVEEQVEVITKEIIDPTEVPREKKEIYVHPTQESREVTEEKISENVEISQENELLTEVCPVKELEVIAEGTSEFIESLDNKKQPNEVLSQKESLEVIAKESSTSFDSQKDNEQVGEGSSVTESREVKGKETSDSTLSFEKVVKQEPEVIEVEENVIKLPELAKHVQDIYVEIEKVQDGKALAYEGGINPDIEGGEPHVEEAQYGAENDKQVSINQVVESDLQEDLNKSVGKEEPATECVSASKESRKEPETTCVPELSVDSPKKEESIEVLPAVKVIEKEILEQPIGVHPLKGSYEVVEKEIIELAELPKEKEQATEIQPGQESKEVIEDKINESLEIPKEGGLLIEEVQPVKELEVVAEDISEAIEPPKYLEQLNEDPLMRQSEVITKEISESFITPNDTEQTDEGFPNAEYKGVGAKEISGSKLGPEEVEKQELEVTKVRDGKEELPEITNLVCNDYVKVEIEAIENGGTMKDEKSLAHGDQSTPPVGVEQIHKEEQCTVPSVELAAVEVSPQDVKEDERKESSNIDGVAKISEMESLVVEKFGEENEDKIVKSEKAGEDKHEKIQELTLPREEEASRDFEIDAVVVEKSTDDQKAGEVADPIAETKIEESIKVEKPEEVETSNTHVHESELEVKDKEAGITGGENPKVNDKKVPSKQSHKHSHNLLSKVKQSLVKAKKAIIGKSPSSKTLSSEAKDDIKVK